METFQKNRLILKSLIENKNVVIVGPAPYLNSKKIGNLINNYDVIIRCNKGNNLIKNPEVFGSRTDILYHCVNQHPENGGKLDYNELKNVKLIVGAYPILSGQEESSFSDVVDGTMGDYRQIPKMMLHKFTTINKERYLSFEKKLCCRPNTGIIAIKDILDLNPKSLYITGFTLFKDGYSKLYRNTIDGNKVTEENSKFFVLKRMKKAKRHNQYLICKTLKTMLINNKKVKLDDEFIKILKFDPNIYKSKINNKVFTDEQLFEHYLEN